MSGGSRPSNFYVGLRPDDAHNIIRNGVALVVEESVIGVSGSSAAV
jgi:hypothetical protein